MTKVFVFDNAKCNGCYGCQLACKDEHVGNDWSPIAAPQPDTGHFWCKLNEFTHGQVPKVRIEYWPTLCNQCDNAPCIEAAPDAVRRRADGLIIIDPEVAKGNKVLVDSCPYGAIYYNEELDLPQKCTGCAHLVDEGMLPHCVDLCATGALRFGEESEFAAEIAQAKRLTDEAHGGKVYYLNRPKLFISGDVWDPESNEIIQGAEVTLSNNRGRFIAKTSTDGFGDFWFKHLDPGTYQILIKAASFMEEFTEVNLDKSLNIGDFPLRPDAVVRKVMPSVTKTNN
ncbi:MAG: carboxypeptidase regulatory-like domain-containing protein [Coriobacteriales bacterium]|jgi:Fe-S-cluster-containing dehydrogenase component|nr:carboxypeptidase regulatory-like domain-containing protein [Coriobacteriales bacterium]